MYSVNHTHILIKKMLGDNNLNCYGTGKQGNLWGQSVGKIKKIFERTLPQIRKVYYSL